MYYRPEGSLIKSAENAMYIANYERLREAMDKEIILEARVAVWIFRAGKGLSQEMKAL